MWINAGVQSPCGCKSASSSCLFGKCTTNQRLADLQQLQPRQTSCLTPGYRLPHEPLSDTTRITRLFQNTIDRDACHFLVDASLPFRTVGFCLPRPRGSVGESFEARGRFRAPGAVSAVTRSPGSHLGRFGGTASFGAESKRWDGRCDVCDTTRFQTIECRILCGSLGHLVYFCIGGVSNETQP